jgi:hypothetical protein
MQRFSRGHKLPGQNSRIHEEKVELLLSTSVKIRANLAKIITKAKRSGVWRKLETIDRGILSLSSKLEVRFRSMDLLRAITRIVKEIAELTSFMYHNYMLGIKSAYRIAEYAVNCGYIEAAGWLNDRNFTIYWGILINPRTYTK